MNLYKAKRIIEHEKEWAINRHIVVGIDYKECEQAFDIAIKALSDIIEIEDIITGGVCYGKEKIL